MKQKVECVKADILLKGKDRSITSENVSREEDRMILSGENMPLLNHGIQVDQACYSEEGLCFMKGQVTLSTPYQVNLTILHEDEPEDRRNYVRVKAHDRVRVIRGFSKGKLAKPFRIDETTQMRDINIGGIGFYSNRRLLKKQNFELDFGFLKKDLIIRARVLRIERMEIPLGYRFKYGCAFEFRNPEEERLICEYVFKVQIRNHRKAMDLDED